MTSRDALRTLSHRLDVRRAGHQGFGPVVGKFTRSGTGQGASPIPRPGVPLDYAVGCVDPIEGDDRSYAEQPLFTPVQFAAMVLMAVIGLALIGYGLATTGVR